MREYTVIINNPLCESEVSDDACNVIVSGSGDVAVVDQPDITVVHVGVPGGGSGGSIGFIETIITASVDVSALLPIKRDGSRCSSSLADAGTFFAVSANGAAAGGSVRGVTGGYLRDASWSWTPGAIYRSPTGTLTQTIPTSGVIHEVAHTVSATEIIIDPQSEFIIA